jgi:hypothetical protein
MSLYPWEQHTRGIGRQLLLKQGLAAEAPAFVPCEARPAWDKRGLGAAQPHGHKQRELRKRMKYACKYPATIDDTWWMRAMFLENQVFAIARTGKAGSDILAMREQLRWRLRWAGDNPASAAWWQRTEAMEDMVFAAGQPLFYLNI